MDFIDKIRYRVDNRKKANDKKALISISSGAFVGALTYSLSFHFNIAIFGWNLAFVFAPLFAGYVETYVSNRIMGETTGAISAYLLFFVTIIHGFILANPTLGFNGITVGAIIVILQAAFPTTVNYFFFVVIVGLFTYFTGYFKELTDRLYYTFVPRWYSFRGKPLRLPKYTLTKDNFGAELNDVDLNKFGVLFMTTTHPWGVNVREYLGVFEGSVIIPNENRLFEIKTKKEEDILLRRFQEAKHIALAELAEEVLNHGGNGVLDLEVDYNIVGELVGDSFHIVAKGTGVLLE